ncbi:MAG: DUF4398 domain-containing protein [Gammaproteobacteria bacterium]
MLAFSIQYLPECLAVLTSRITKIIRIGWVALCAGLLLAACAGPPVQEMSDARQAIQAAEDAGADDSAPMVLQQARDYLSSAEQKLQKRAYNGARVDARLAREKASHAITITRQRHSEP